ncbi:MAG: hypothetical protein HY293_20440 [Planctomycetes bacterium]|nr:hypothetical protein [Planctomycetota bacterium]
MTTSARAFAGAALGVLFASAAFPLGMALLGGRVAESALFIAILILPVMAVCAGPGAWVLAYIHSALLEHFARGAASRKSILRRAILLGLPLGVGNLIVTLFGLALISGEVVHLTGRAEDIFPYLISALAGGAGLGWGCTLELRPGRVPAPRPVRKVGRRDGAPFFDSRISRRAS